ncbi:MAG: ribbon-helix-helix protein, CopG family [Crenarchaeota archaeon]|nr:ribbon-helix-helix protein, CopG family [Thermoproteota archaeon]
MGKYVTVSTKVKKELKEEAERLGINISAVLREALEREVKKKRIEEIKKKLDELSDVLELIDIDRIVSHIREDREKR